MQRGIAKLGDVVRRNRGRHADRDALGAIGKQIGKPAGQHNRLFRLAVVIGAKFDPVLINAVEQKPRHLGHSRFGVAVGSGIIAVDIAEIALAIDQRVARGEILREADHGVVDRLVAMGMERTHDVADDLGGFLERRAGIEPQQPHAVEDTAMHRLQAVAGIRQRAMHDGRKRVGEVTLLERIAQHDLMDFSRFRRNQPFPHTVKTFSSFRWVLRGFARFPTQAGRKSAKRRLTLTRSGSAYTQTSHATRVAGTRHK